MPWIDVDSKDPKCQDMTPYHVLLDTGEYSVGYYTNNSGGTWFNVWGRELMYVVMWHTEPEPYEGDLK